MARAAAVVTRSRSLSWRLSYFFEGAARPACFLGLSRGGALDSTGSCPSGLSTAALDRVTRRVGAGSSGRAAGTVGEDLVRARGLAGVATRGALALEDWVRPLALGFLTTGGRTGSATLLATSDSARAWDRVRGLVARSRLGGIMDENGEQWWWLNGKNQLASRLGFYILYDLPFLEGKDLLMVVRKQGTESMA